MLTRSFSGGLLVAMLLGSVVEARPQYATEFKKLYPILHKQTEFNSCTVCHFPDEKKTLRNDYGKSFGATLNGKNIPNPGVIKKAMKDTEKEKSGVNGKTFGDLIRDRQLPGKNPGDLR